MMLRMNSVSMSVPLLFTLGALVTAVSCEPQTDDANDGADPVLVGDAGAGKDAGPVPSTPPACPPQLYLYVANPERHWRPPTPETDAGTPPLSPPPLRRRRPPGPGPLPPMSDAPDDPADGGTDTGPENGAPPQAAPDGGVLDGGVLDGGVSATLSDMFSGLSVDAGVLLLDQAQPSVGQTDEFGPNAETARTATALARVNIYEVTSPSVLTDVAVYLEAVAPNTQVTLAIHQAPDQETPFERVFSTTVQVGECPGFAASGPIAVPLTPGAFYAVGFDPNQSVRHASGNETGILPIDGRFGQLIGSKTTNTVTGPLNWDKLSNRDYNRQRLTTQPAP